MKTIRIEELRNEEPCLENTINEVILMLGSTLKRCIEAYDKWSKSGGNGELPWGTEGQFCSRLQLVNLRTIIDEISSFPNITKQEIHNNILWYSWPDQEFVLAPLIANKAKFNALIECLGEIYMEVNKNGNAK